MKKILIILGIVLAIGFFLRVFVFKKAGAKEKIVTKLAVEYVVSKKTNIVKTSDVMGTIIADKTAQVFPETMGRVMKILVKDGSIISKGDRLMAIKNETVGFEFEEAYIISPISGAVARVLVDVGSMVAPPAPVAVVVDFSRVKVSFNAPEVDASYFTLNRKITLNVDALPGQKFYANITEVSPVIDPMTRTVSIKALAENPKRLLKPGMTARITMVMAERKDVVAVPKDAIIGDFIYVVKADSMTEKRIVTLGLSGDEMTEITMGLDENEMVVVLGQQRLAGNEKVNPIERQ